MVIEESGKYDIGSDRHHLWYEIWSGSMEVIVIEVVEGQRWARMGRVPTGSGKRIVWCEEKLKEHEQKQESNLVNSAWKEKVMTVTGNVLGKKITEKSKGWWSETVEKEICSRK